MFSLKTNGAGFKVLHAFSDASNNTNGDGYGPYGGLVLSNDTLYGTATFGGAGNEGTVFTVKIDGSGFSTLHSFASLDTNWDNSEGAQPYGDLILSNGILYGTAMKGGPAGSCAIFAINTDGTGFRTLYAFSAMSLSQENSDGAAPRGGLVLSGNTLYGGAYLGGSFGGGVIFGLNTNGTGFKVVHTFSPANNDGIAPRGDLILSGDTLYGSTEGAGPAGNGTVFCVSTAGGDFKTLYGFSGTDVNGNNIDGTNPQGGLVLSNGTLFGATYGGGSGASGTVFSLRISSQSSGPVISQQPMDLTVNIGQSAVITVVAQGSAPLHYQWLFKGKPIANARNSTYTINAAQWADNGAYSVIVSDSAGSTTSSTATLTVHEVVVPTVTITSPAPNFTTDQAVITVKGTASDPVGISQVRLTLNGATPVLVKGSKSWSATLTLQLGDNSVSVQSYNLSGIASTPAVRNYVFNASSGTNPFVGVAGSYNGLFYPTNGMTEQNAGFFSATISAKSQANYSGLLLLDGGRYPFTSTFDLSGDSQIRINRPGKTPVVVNLHLNVSAPDNLLSGSVSNANWFAPMLADRAVFNAASNPDTNDIGRFTMLLPPAPDAPVSSPGGYGYAVFSNSSAGIALFSGYLADGTAISPQSVAIAPNGRVPIYVSLYAGKGSLLGWLNFSNKPPQTLTGWLSWIKPISGPRTLYPAGFANLMTIAGSPFSSGSGPLLALTRATLIISNGNLAAPLSFNVDLEGTNITKVEGSTNELSASINRATGLMAVKFRPTGASLDTAAQGVILQNQTNAAGWFDGTSESGAFWLQ